jgi:competence protein ComGC
MKTKNICVAVIMTESLVITVLIDILCCVIIPNVWWSKQSSDKYMEKMA